MAVECKICYSTKSRNSVKSLIFYLFYAKINNMNVKENLAINIAKHRKALGLTQAELAEQLNYSDKAVSKWERGDAVPEITVLKQLADFYGVTVDTLLSQPKEEKAHPVRDLGKRRLYTGLWSLCIVWLVAILCYAFIDIIFPWIFHPWLFFIYALPVSFILILILTSVWGNNIANLIISSLLVWAILGSVYLSLLVALPTPPSKLWEIFLIGVPLEGFLVFLFLYNRSKIKK